MRLVNPTPRRLKAIGPGVRVRRERKRKQKLSTYYRTHLYGGSIVFIGTFIEGGCACKVSNVPIMSPYIAYRETYAVYRSTYTEYR